MKNSGHSCKTSSKQPSMGIMSRENSQGGFPLPSSRFLPSSVLLLDSSIIDTSMQGSCQRQSCCHRAVMVVQERCCAFELSCRKKQHHASKNNPFLVCHRAVHAWQCHTRAVEGPSVTLTSRQHIVRYHNLEVRHLSCSKLQHRASRKCQSAVHNN